MSDLVDLLRRRMAECSCSVAGVIGRTDLGCVPQKRWQEGCEVHPTRADVDADNERAFARLLSLPAPEKKPVRKRRWWRR